MKIQINGNDREFDSPLSLSALVENLGMKPDRVAVELNRSIVPREQWHETSLVEGDRLEMVHFVGGGSDQRSDPAQRTLLVTSASDQSLTVAASHLECVQTFHPESV